MNKKKIIGSAVVGNIVEYYDFGIYAVFAESIGRLYLPNPNEYIQLMLSFAVFAIGFLMRPLGGVLLGHIGDVFGRKVALSISIIGMGLSTVLIGLLPTYSQIGVWSSIFLILIRIFQGLCIGGESAGAAIFILEHFHKTKVGLIGSIIMASNITGTLLALLTGILIKKLFGIDDFTWRYGFFLGGITGVIGYYMRRSAEETPVFEKIRRERKTSDILPIMVVLRKKWRSVLLIAALASVATSNTYMLRGFFSVYFTEIIGVDKEQSLYLVSFSLISVILFLPFFGLVSDHIGYKKYIYSVVFSSSLLIIPLFRSIIISANNLNSLYYCMFLSGALVASIVAPYYPFSIKFFSPELRYSGIALSWNIGNALFGGTTPMVSTFLVMTLGKTAPAYYLVAVSCLFMFISLLNRKILIDH